MRQINEQAPEPQDNEGLESLFSELEIGRNSFFEAIQKCVKLPVLANMSNLGTAANFLSSALYDFTEGVLNDQLSDEYQKGKIIAVTYLDEAIRRKIFLASLFGNDENAIIADNSEEEDVISSQVTKALFMCKEDELTIESLAHSLVDIYGNEMEVDINIFMKKVSGGLKSKAIDFAEAARKHSIDVLKISLGVAIGGLAVNYIGHKRP